MSRITVRYLIMRYMKHGVIYLPQVGSKPRVLPPGVEEWLIGKEHLKRMAFLTIRERCDLLWETHRVKMGPHGLINLYKRHGIGYKRSRTQTKRVIREHELDPAERKEAAKDVLNLVASTTPLVYLDETTIHVGHHCQSKRMDGRALPYGE